MYLAAPCRLGGSTRVLLIVFFSVVCVLSVVVYVLYMVCDLFEMNSLMKTLGYTAVTLYLWCVCVCVSLCICLYLQWDPLSTGTVVLVMFRIPMAQ